MARRQTDPGAGFTVMFLDLDGFKLVNDSLGHEQGDKLLVAFAERIVALVQPGDTLARLGGDEFPLLLDNLADDQALAIPERIRQALAAPVHLNGLEISVSVSIGIVLQPAPELGAEEILRDADTAMYRAKAQGRGQYVLFDATMHSQALERLRLEIEPVAGGGKLRHQGEAAADPCPLRRVFIQEELIPIGDLAERLTGVQSADPVARGIRDPDVHRRIARHHREVAGPVRLLLRQARLEVEGAERGRLAPKHLCNGAVQQEPLGGTAAEIVKGLIGIVRADEIEGQVFRCLDEVLPDQEAQPRLGQIVGPLRHRLLGDVEDIGRKRPGGRRGHAPGLPQEPHRRIDQIGGQPARVGDDQRIGGKGDIEFPHAQPEDEPALNACLLGLEGGGRHLAGPLGDQVIFDRGRGTGQDRLDLLVQVLARGEHGAGERPLVQMGGDEVGGSLCRIGDRHEEVIGLAAADRGGVAQGDREIGVPHQDRTRGLALDGDRTDGKPFQGGGDRKIELVGPFLQPLDRRIDLAAFPGVEEADIVACAELPIRPSVQDRHGTRVKCGNGGNGIC